MIGKHTCLRCKNYIDTDTAENGEFGYCRAYPNGIPDTVYAFMHHWDTPKDCNNGIGFEPKENSDKPSE